MTTYLAFRIANRIELGLAKQPIQVCLRLDYPSRSPELSRNTSTIRFRWGNFQLDVQFWEKLRKKMFALVSLKIMGNYILKNRGCEVDP